MRRLRGVSEEWRTIAGKRCDVGFPAERRRQRVVSKKKISERPAHQGEKQHENEESAHLVEEYFRLSEHLFQAREVTSHVQAIHQRVMHLDRKRHQRPFIFLAELSKRDLGH